MKSLLTRYNSKRRQYKHQHPLQSQQRKKERPKEVRFDHVLKKPPGQGFDTPFRFDTLAQLANIPARITIHELIRFSKETREALRDALANSESFLTCMPEVPNDEFSLLAQNAITYNQRCPPLHSRRKICFSKITSTIDLCTTPDISVQPALKESKSIRSLHSASSPKGSSTSSAYHCTGCLQPPLQYTVSMPGAVTHLGKSGSVAESGA